MMSASLGSLGSGIVTLLGGVVYSSLSCLCSDDSGGGFSSLLVGFWSMLFLFLVAFRVDIFGRTMVIPTLGWVVMFLAFVVQEVVVDGKAILNLIRGLIG